MPIYPQLAVQPTSMLSFPWAEFISRKGTTADMALGHGGVTLGMCMLVEWDNLEAAVSELIGYSWRDTTTSPPTLRRNLPWQHPYWSQMWCQRVVKAEGIKFLGKDTIFRTGPVSEYQLVLLTLQFGRPNYAILSDTDILDGFGDPQEWLRYTDRIWTPNIQMLSREGMTFNFTEGTDAYGKQFPGSVGQKLGKLKLTRRWYQLPEQAIYDANGFPANLTLDPNTGECMMGSVNDAEFFGCDPGTLLYETPEIIPQPLPLPPNLMGIIGEDFQLQYDVVFHFEYFNPPLGRGAVSKGHNCMPYSQDGKWYKVASQSGATTTIASSITAGTRTVTPASMSTIKVGCVVHVTDGGSSEDVEVTAITGTTFTAVFAYNHTAPVNITVRQPPFDYSDFSYLFQIL